MGRDRRKGRLSEEIQEEGIKDTKKDRSEEVEKKERWKERKILVIFYEFIGKIQSKKYTIFL